MADASATYLQLGKPESATSVEVKFKRRKRAIMIEVQQEGMVEDGAETHLV